MSEASFLEISNELQLLMLNLFLSTQTFGFLAVLMQNRAHST